MTKTIELSVAQKECDAAQILFKNEKIAFQVLAKNRDRLIVRIAVDSTNLAALIDRFRRNIKTLSILSIDSHDHLLKDEQHSKPCLSCRMSHLFGFKSK